MKSIFKSLALLAALAGFTALASAGTITLTVAGLGGRTGELTDAVSGFAGDEVNYNNAPDIAALFGGTWVNEGDLAPADGSPGGVYSHDLFTVNLTTGSWGSSNVGGTWSINPIFWTLWGKAVISMHVGQGNGDPDAFAWLVTPGETSGTWSYYDHDGTGGGLSNIKLWGSDKRTRVPDRGTTVLLIALGLAALAVTVRRTKAS